MTSLEHVSVKHALDRLPSWAGIGGGVIAEVEVKAEAVAEEAEVEEVGVGLAITTDDDEAEVAQVSNAVGEGRPHAEDEHRYSKQDGPQNDDDEGVGGGGGGVGTSACASDASRPSSRGASTSPSRSDLHSHSRSQSSARGQLGESSVATSWTQADVEGQGARRSGDSGSERRPSDEVHCRHRADGHALEEGAVEERTEVVSLSHMRPGTDRTGGDVSRKEEVLVMQEEDIGEAWHPLRHNGKARSQADDEVVQGEHGETEVDVGAADPLRGEQSLETGEKDRWRTFGSSGRITRHLRLEFKSPSPQPWDEIDPPTDNNEAYTSDYYSTLNSKKFGTLQKSRRRRLIPHSSYYFGPPPSDSAYGTPPVGQIGIHHPREIVRIERDYLGGELTQFSPVFPLELEGRITPTQFHQTVNDINEILISAHSIRHAFVDNLLAVITLQLSTLVTTTHYAKEMRRLKEKIEELNARLYNPVGLRILWPERVAFLFLEIEYY